jgi:glycine C-acetyltransferase/8-amino-7-oxononanoate synthase
LGCLAGIDLHMGTLGKALGCAGAYLAADRAVIDTLINRSRSFIFSTSLPASVPASALAAVDLVESAAGAELRKNLADNRELFARRLQQGGVDLLGSVTQIVPVLTGEPGPTMAAAERLLAGGVLLQGIRPPTVPPGRCRLRATVMAVHRPQELAAAAELILQTVGGDACRS